MKETKICSNQLRYKWVLKKDKNPQNPKKSYKSSSLKGKSHKGPGAEQFLDHPCCNYFYFDLIFAEHLLCVRMMAGTGHEAVNKTVITLALMQLSFWLLRVHEMGLFSALFQSVLQFKSLRGNRIGFWVALSVNGSSWVRCLALSLVRRWRMGEQRLFSEEDQGLIRHPNVPLLRRSSLF